MPADIYAQHDAAFRAVSAFVVLKDGERVATIALKHGNAVTAFVHWLGVEMVKGIARGGGYDRASAACSVAAAKAIATIKVDPNVVDFPRATFFRILRDDDSRRWNDRLEAAGFRVVQAV